MKRLFLVLISTIMLITSFALPVSAANTVLGRTVIFEQTQSHAEGNAKKLSSGVRIKDWYTWFVHGGDGFDKLYDALSDENAELIVKYKGDFDLSASFTHWGSVSSVSCTDVVIEGEYNYAIFDSDAVKRLFTAYESNSANINADGSVKGAMALSLDGQRNGECDVVYGLYVVSALPVDPAFSTTATINMNKTYQTIDGFGASYTWYSDWMIGIDMEEQGYDYIFEEAEFNILRFRDQHGLAGDEKKAPLEGYPKYKAYYDAAIKRGIDPIVLVTSWGQYDRSLPFVQFIEKSANGYSYYTLAKNKKGEYMYDELAEFCVQSVKYFFDAGIPVDYFSISNEIELQELHKDEQGNARNEAGFFFGTEETEDRCAYWKAHLAVYEAFEKAFGDKAPSIIGAETMAGNPNLLHEYLDPLIENYPETLDVVAHHLYGTQLSKRNFQSLYSDFGEDYRLWQTEWYCNDYMQLGEVILDQLVYENITAYLYWNGVWPHDDGNCLLEISDWSWVPEWIHTATITRMPAHYIMTHFSKFIKPGYQRADVSEGLKSNIGAFKSPDGKKLVVIASNNTSSNETLNLSFDGKITGSKVYQSTESDSKYFKDVGKFKNGLSLPAGSLTTIVFELDSQYTPPAIEEPKEEFTFTVEEMEETTMYSTISLNVRSGPSIDFDKIDTLKEGEAVTVTGIASTGWYQVLVDGEVGYVSGKYLTDEAPKVEEPTVEEPKEEEPIEEQPEEEAPAEDVSTEVPPVEDEPTEDEPTEEIPVEDEPIEDEPSDEAPAEDDPVEEVPAEDEPIEEPALPDDEPADSDIDLDENSSPIVIGDMAWIIIAVVCVAVVATVIFIIIIKKKKI